ncbi:MAG: hypothetical protein GC168_11130 [Candidatus Hydrogenedens sp.]|nr:hypothetical protein [Candidatus Hydrogenedens sp.]
MNLTVDVGSDVTDFAPNALSSSVTHFVSIDNTPPDFEILTVNPGVGSEGTLVEISFDTPSLLSGDPNVTVNGHPATLVTKGNLVYTYQYTVLATDPAGFATIAISGADPAGNIGTLNNNSLLEIVDSEETLPGVPVAAWPAAAMLLALGIRVVRRRR